MISARDEFCNVSLLSAKEVMALEAAGFRTPVDLLDHLPRRHEDRRRFDAFPNQPTAGPVCLRGLVVDAGPKGFGGRRFTEAVVMDGSGGVFGSGKVTCRWFNMPFMHKLVAAGQEIIIFGRVKESTGRLVIDHPEFEVLREEDPAESIHVDRVVPVYRNLSGLSQRRLRELMHGLLSRCDPAGFEREWSSGDGGTRHAALVAAHFPATVEAGLEARRRFALEEFFALQLNVVWRRARFRDRQGRVLGLRTGLLKRFHTGLPFDLTEAQKRSVREIVGDLRSERPMHRLLQGDVGSGKTFVAMAAMVLAVDSGCQAALMAPTQILAEQHFLTFRRWLGPLNVRIALKTGNREEMSHPELDGRPQIVIGTHALLFDGVAFEDLGLVVIDEQHKFGVAQRAALIRQGVMPDVLVMTATPIPRTLTMTVYGDLDVSVLDEKPPGRARVVTAVRVAPKQTDVTKFLKDQLSQGRQAYLVYPLVEESEGLRVESATVAHEKWRKRLAGHEVGLLHGKLRPEEKEAVMGRFRDGEIAVLVATSVIEVGVDVPNASVMVVHHAERFGLAQLHQLRGRIGRGGHKGYCVLLSDGKSAEGLDKLRVLEGSSDGFEIAEADLRLRGPGDVLGTAQSGLGDLRFTDFLRDMALLRQARALADAVIAEDPQLDGRHAGLRALVHDETAGGGGDDRC